MAGPERTPKNGDGSLPDVDPWAPGGAMASVPPKPSSGQRFAFATDERAPQPSRPRDRRWLGGVVLAVLIGGGVLAVTSGDANSPTDSAPTAPSISLASALPETLPPPTQPRPTPPPLLAEPVIESVPANPAQRLALAAAPSEYIVDVAAELSEINPTEIVALSADGQLWEVSLPSGRVRVTDLGFPITSAQQLAVNDGGAVVWPAPEGGAQIVGTAGATAITTSNVSNISWSPTATQMYLWDEQREVSGITTEATVVDLEGGVPTRRSADWLHPTEGPTIALDFDGALLREDTGGTYRIAEEGTVLRTTGDVVSTGPNHLLIRECDAIRTCALVSIDRGGERRVWPADLPRSVAPQAIGGLSPAGDALLLAGDRFNAAIPRELQVLELADGNVSRLVALPDRTGRAAWDTGGTGVFLSGEQLVYVDRFTGETTAVSEELPPLRSVETRRPLATPVCEILAMTQPQFALMADGGATNTVSPPSAEVLHRLAELLPAEVVGSATPTITFVTSFVSAETAGSQTVANWPANVRAGLDALDSYATSSCPLITPSPQR